MAATTINRTSLTLTNDTGTASNPDANGTLLNAALWTLLLDRIDALHSGALTLGGVFSSEGFGSHTISSGGTGGQRLYLRNTTAGTGNFAQISLGNNATDTQLALSARSTTYTTAAPFFADGADIYAAGSGGLSIVSAHASGTMRLYTANTLRTTWEADGTFNHASGLVMSSTADAALSGSTAPSGITPNEFVIRVTSASSTPKFSGLVKSYDGEMHLVVNASGADFSFEHEYVGLSAASRIYCPDATNVTMKTNDSALIWYDGTTARWRVLARGV